MVVLEYPVYIVYICIYTYFESKIIAVCRQTGRFEKSAEWFLCLHSIYVPSAEFISRNQQIVDRNQGSAAKNCQSVVTTGSIWFLPSICGYSMFCQIYSDSLTTSSGKTDSVLDLLPFRFQKFIASSTQNLLA